MVAVSLSREVYREPESLRKIVVARVSSILEATYGDSVNAARVESIVCNAEGSLVSMDVRLTPALSNVILDFKVDQNG